MKKKYTVSNIPLLIRPLYLVCSVIVASFVYGLFFFSHLLVRIEYQNKEVLKSRGNYIFSMWHENLVPYFIVNIRYRSDYIWLNHPAWFMKPIHIILWFMGTKKLALGSSGNAGRAGLEEVVSYLRKGYNTLINPDGPSGPLKELKHGVLDMSMESEVPVISVKISTARAITLSNTWDQKRIPLPFSKMTVTFSEPVQVTDLNKEEARQKIIAGM